MAIAQLLALAVAIAVAGLVVAVALLIKNAHGRPRVLGIIGATLILLGLLARFAFQWMIARYLGQVDTEAIINVMAVDTVLAGVLTGAGLLVITRAIVVAGWPSWMSS